MNQQRNGKSRSVVPAPTAAIPDKNRIWYLNRAGALSVEHPVPKMDSVKLPECDVLRIAARIRIWHGSASSPQMLPAADSIADQSAGSAGPGEMRWRSKARCDEDESSSRFRPLFKHDLFGKPLRSFPDHALESRLPKENEICRPCKSTGPLSPLKSRARQAPRLVSRNAGDAQGAIS